MKIMVETENTFRWIQIRIANIKIKLSPVYSAKIFEDMFGISLQRFDAYKSQPNIALSRILLDTSPYLRVEDD
jgi:hypothetical protein